MKRRILLSMLASFILFACKKDKENTNPQSPASQTPKAYVEVIDFETGQPLEGVKVTLGLYDESNDTFKESVYAITDNLGTCAFIYPREYFQLKAETTDEYFSPYRDFPGMGADLRLWNSNDVSAVYWKGRTGYDNYFTVNVFRKAPTQIHLKQINQYSLADTTAYFRLEHLVPGAGNDLEDYNVKYTHLLNNGNIVLSPNRLLDTLIHVDLIANMENSLGVSIKQFIPSSFGNPEATKYFGFPPQRLVANSTNYFSVEF